MNITISPVRAADAEAITALARIVWEDAYPGIISRQQIDYMLAQGYSRERLLQDLRTPEVWWDQAKVDGELAAFMSMQMTTTPGEMKIDKLYVDPQRQGFGLGGRLIAHAARRAGNLGCTTLMLSVNKANDRAIAAYRKHGFETREPVTVDIGNGFVMDDFIMAKTLLPGADTSQTA